MQEIIDSNNYIIFQELKRATSNEYCLACGKKLYMVERSYSNGYCIHKVCLRCAVCKCLLRPGTSHAYQGEGEKLGYFYEINSSYNFAAHHSQSLFSITEQFVLYRIFKFQ